MDEPKQFLDRFKEFWQTYNPGRQPTEDVVKSGRKCYQILASKRIDYRTFNRICTQLEADMPELPYSFNLAAYTIDAVLSEREEEAMRQNAYDARPVQLPKEGKEINIDRLKPAIDILNKNCPELGIRGLLERINAHRKNIKTGYLTCKACDNTGYITFSVWTDDDGFKVIMPNKVKVTDNPDYTMVKRCRCPKGQALKEDCRQASFAECGEAAIMNGGQYKDSVDTAPF